jgi:hypothetical protein
MKYNTKINITKASGEHKPFSKEKFLNSLMHSGASPSRAQEILEEISKQLHEGISTKKIYQLAYSKLKKQSKHLAARYHLKQAIMELGPSGYPFEKFIGELLKQKGFSVEVGIIIKGKCVTHEVDVLAKNATHQFMIECKYHNYRGIFCDVKIPLYIQSRFKDVESEWIKNKPNTKLIYQGWVVTNTKFSTDAILYGNCAGLKLLSWDYPENESLKKLIDDSGLYPITCLTTLTKLEKQKLLENKIVLCKELNANKKQLSEIGMTDNRINNVFDESKKLCDSTLNTLS